MKTQNNNKRIIGTTPSHKVIPSEHFHIKGIKTPFDISGLIPLYLYVSKNLETMEIGKDYEYDFGIATIAFSIDLQNNIRLITGWVGSRDKQNNSVKGAAYLRKI